jgi:hypothetical protein
MTLTLIDAVREAGQAVAAKHEALAVAKQAFVDAQAAVAKAEHAAEHAKHTDDSAALVQAVEDADLLLRRAKTQATVAASQLVNAREVHAVTLHDSLQADHDQARAARLAACTKADAARAMLAEAEADFHAANGMLTRAYNAGRRRQFDGALLAMHVELDAGSKLHVPSAALDAELWATFAVQA